MKLGRSWPLVSCTRVIGITDCQSSRHSALNSHTAARVLTAEDCVQYRIGDVDEPAVSDRQLIYNGSDHAMTGVEFRECTLPSTEGFGYTRRCAGGFAKL